MKQRRSNLPNVRLGSIASFCPWAHHFRSTPINKHSQGPPACPKSASERLMHRSKLHLYSMTSSARASSVGGTVMPSAFAVLRLTII
jgi:hypothetical protein